MSSILSLRPLSPIATEHAVQLAIGCLATAVTYLQRGRMPHDHAVMGMITAVRSALLGYDGVSEIKPEPESCTARATEVLEARNAAADREAAESDRRARETFTVRTEEIVSEIKPDAVKTGHDIEDRDNRFVAEVARRVRVSKKDAKAFLGKGAGEVLARLEGAGRIVYVKGSGRTCGYRVPPVPRTGQEIAGETDAAVLAPVKPAVSEIKPEPDAVVATAANKPVKARKAPAVKKPAAPRKSKKAEIKPTEAPEPAKQETAPIPIPEPIKASKGGAGSLSDKELMDEIARRIDERKGSARMRGHYLELRTLMIASKK